MFFLGVLLFLGAEIASFVLVAGQIGFLWAIGLVLVVSALGPFVVRHVGVGVLDRTRDRLARGEVPTRELLDGLVVLMGGVLICVPGFISDSLGLLLMVRPLRHLVIRAAGTQLARRVPTVRIRSWRATDTPSREVGDNWSPPTQPSHPSLGPGDEDGRSGPPA